ncbi:Ig kappa chain V-V region T1 [Chanos chanos]|uniref:Ig kappa chain V-V region T1 n=1 Tax=Chanos chanos TaxID=29144 RepID=A0AC58UVX5_CHACN
MSACQDLKLWSPVVITGIPNVVFTLQLKQIQIGDYVTLDCNISFHHEITWLRVRSGMDPEVVVVAGLNSDGQMSTVWSMGSNHFSGSVKNRSIALIIRNVSEEDLGSYYCVTKDGRMLQFGKGAHLYETLKISCGSSQLYQIYAAVLGIGQLMMIVAVVIVHMKTKKRNKD